ncbi:twin-arginine translocase TatA/TatE family subunit [Paenibacillus sp. IB182496]|uniref:Sec-independent protein translocase protein TatA n=1 Tax=Paenibacillus sabuli TaxID=2772509 RepID=A0A927BVL3_9BACL|nr:twin-arginine translocase TatA/TatE family subunit [Paenibacillus sabuli]MBD2847162.1 twin-arginine translocase TatA/TatE family subunit [Paenibacillus sabuli]
MSGLGVSGVILLIVVALLLFGPKKLPELGRAFGSTLREFKKGAREIMEDDDKQDRKDASRTEAREEQPRAQRLPD